MLSADEVGRAMSGSFKLLNRNAEGLGAFEISLPAFWRSFLAVFLTAPALVTAIAFDRKALGLPAEAGLFSDPWIVVHELGMAAAAWIVFPLAMIWVVRRLDLGRRYVGYIIAYNWSAVLASTIFALPTALYVLGFASEGLATLYALAFGIIVLQYRWFLAKAALGISGGVAALIVAGDFGVNALIAMVMGIG